MTFIGRLKVFLMNSATDVIGLGVTFGLLIGPCTWTYAASNWPLLSARLVPIQAI
jgi:hypothetical protein